MPPVAESAETVLIVDDEDSVRRTFRDWLAGADLGCRILTAGDAAAALALADQHVIDLAVLDWNLGAGQDGLQLLEDLTAFNPDVVAIMVTGFANQATPLMAMRMGVRDYLDKNQHLDRDVFMTAVRRQLDRIRPARREKRIHQGLTAFRAAVERVIPLVQTAAALQDPVPLPTAIRSLFAFLRRTTGAGAGVLVVYAQDSSRPEPGRAYDTEGQALDARLVPLGLAGRMRAGDAGNRRPRSPRGDGADGSVDLQPFEIGRQHVLAAPLLAESGVQVVLELFDRDDGLAFTEADRDIVRASAAFGGELIRQAIAERQTHRLLFDAIAAALCFGDEVAQTLRPLTPANHKRRLRISYSTNSAADCQGIADGAEAATTIRLAEAIQILARGIRNPGSRTLPAPGRKPSAAAR